MRIFTLLAFSIFISSISSAQQKGDLFIGGTIGFSDYKTATNDQAQRQKNFYVDPTIGKFYANNRMAGINVGYSYSRFRDSLRSYSLKAGLFCDSTSLWVNHFTCLQMKV